MRIAGLEVIPGVLAGEKVELTYGQSLRVNTGFKYRGPSKDITLYGAIGEQRGWILGGFVEKVSGEASIRLPDSRLDFSPVPASVNIPITAAIAPGANYDLQCKIKEHLEAGLPEVDNIITITGMPPPPPTLLEHTIYPYAYVYEGPHEGGIFTFKTDPFTPAAWISGRLAAAVESEIRKAGGKMLELRVYVDKSPLLWTNWRLEVVTAPPKTTAGLAMPLGIAWWVAAILLALVLAIIIAITYLWKEVTGTFKRQVGLEDVKPTWKKDTLIKTIQDSEEYWERTPTPVETLGGMSEGELRDYLDKIAEEEVVPPVEGLGLAIAAAAVLGLGALALGAMAIGRPKEMK